MMIKLLAFLLFFFAFSAQANDYDNIFNELSNIKSSTEQSASEREADHAKFLGFAKIQNYGVQLSDEEKGIIRQYTRDQTSFNNNLKKGLSIDHSSNWAAKDLNDALKKLPNSTEVTYRGLISPKDIYGTKIIAGDTVSNNLFMSTSYSPSLAKGFSQSAGEAERNVYFRVQGRTGKNISPVSRFQGQEGESESVFGPGTHFKVLAIKTIKKVRTRTYVLLSENNTFSGLAKNIYTGEPVEVSSYNLR